MLLLGAAPLRAQEKNGEWDVTAEANGSVFFGNSSQRLISTGGSVARADSALEVRGDGRFTYAEAAPQGEDLEVTRRSWELSLAVDRHPYARFSPFVLGSAESSLEKRIDLRYAAGAGGKLTLVRDTRTRSSFSLALLGERTRSLDSLRTASTATRARWSARFRARHDFDERWNVSQLAFYRPQLADFGDYTVSNETQLAFQMTEALGFTVSFIDGYDSEAVLRGARSNNDGQLLFGLQASF